MGNQQNKARDSCDCNVLRGGFVSRFHKCAEPLDKCIDSGGCVYCANANVTRAQELVDKTILREIILKNEYYQIVTLIYPFYHTYNW